MISRITPENVLNPTPADSSWRKKSIPFLGGRPKRDIPITADDINNLIIASNTCVTLEEFFSLT